MSRGKGQRGKKRERESVADSVLSTEPYVALSRTARKIVNLSENQELDA